MGTNCPSDPHRLSDQSAERFPHRLKDSHYESICRVCFRTIASSRDESELAIEEEKHVCDPWDVERMSRAVDLTLTPYEVFPSLTRVSDTVSPRESPPAPPVPARMTMSR
jgi:hypothetical protein